MAFHLWARQRNIGDHPLPPAPARVLMRDIRPLDADETLSQAIVRFRQHQVAELPVTENWALVGWLHEDAVADHILSDEEQTDLPVRSLMAPVPAVLHGDQRGLELLALFQVTGQSLLPVTTPAGQYLGSVSRVDALAAQEGWFPPPRIGGMATPLGVYLTTGSVSGGAGNLGLVLTGMLLVVIMWLSQTALAFVIQYLAKLVPYNILHRYLYDLWRLLTERDVSGPVAVLLSLFLLATMLRFAVLLLVLRFFPLIAGYHAAEHQTVNAIEASEPLVPDAVKRMPRVHPRCGTNLVSIISLSYCGVTSIAMLLSTQLGQDNLINIVIIFAFAIIFVAATWKRIGGWIQQHCTTRPASAKELASGIAAGKEILRRHLETPFILPRRGVRLWRMGFVQVLLGATAMLYLLQWLDGLWKFLVK